MHMAIIFYGFTVGGSIIFSLLYMKKFWTKEMFDEINKIENESNTNEEGV